MRQLCLLQSATRWYYKVRQLFYYKVRQVLYKVRQVLLQSATAFTKCDVITKCDGTHGRTEIGLIVLEFIFLI